jgi:hypothetical protein
MSLTVARTLKWAVSALPSHEKRVRPARTEGSSGKKTVWTAAAAVVAAVDCCCCTPVCPCSPSSERDGHYLIEKDQTESLRK